MVTLIEKNIMDYSETEIQYLRYSTSAASSLSPTGSPLITRINTAARLIPNSISKGTGSVLIGSLIRQLHKRITANVIINLFIPYMIANKCSFVKQ